VKLLDVKIRFLKPAVLAAVLACSGIAQAQTPPAATQEPATSPSTLAPKDSAATGPFRGPLGYLQMPTGPHENLPPNTMSFGISAEAKMNFYQSMMMMNPMSLRQMINIMVTKKQVEKGVSFDDVIESMKLRANKRNFKFVGHSPLYKDVVAITGKTDTPRVEIFSFCDAAVARDILDYVPEFIAFLPCRIAVLEDSKKAIWLVTLDWDVRWLDTSNHPDKITKELREKAVNIRDAIEDIMSAGAKGEL
jgi:uncharacterized protein (DUF302 family)